MNPILGHAYLGMCLKPFNKLAVRALSSLKHSAAPCVLNLIKHSCSSIKHYTNSTHEMLASFKYWVIKTREHTSFGITNNTDMKGTPIL